MNEYGTWRNSQLLFIPHRFFYYLEAYCVFFFSKVETAAGVKYVIVM